MAKNKIDGILFMVPDCFKIKLNGIKQTRIVSENFRIKSKADSPTSFVPLPSLDI